MTLLINYLWHFHNSPGRSSGCLGSFSHSFLNNIISGAHDHPCFTSPTTCQSDQDDDHEWELEFPNEHLREIEVRGWYMYFNGAVNNKGAGVGVILITPEGKMIQMAKRLEFEVTNNQAEYEARIFRLEAL